MSTVSGDLFIALRTMLMGLFPGIEIVKGLGNDVSMPTGPFISMTAVSQRRLATNLHIYDDLGALQTPKVALGNVANQQSTEIQIQVDCYGPLSSDWAAAICTVWRDQYSTDLFRSLQASPLWAEPPRMIPLDDSSRNYEERWVVILVLQYNPQTITAMDFFDTTPITYENQS